MSTIAPIMTVFCRGVNKRDRNVTYVTNATRADGTNYLLARFTIKNEFGKQELPVLEAAIRKDIKKAYDNADYNPSNVEVVNIKFDNDNGRSILRTGYVSINVR